MYRVHGNDGETYEAPSLAVLQQWVIEGRIIASTTVEDLLSGTEGPASGIAGLKFGPAQFGEGQVQNSDYPRVAPQQPVGCAVHMPLILAIVSTACFWPLGVVGVIYAAKIPQILEQGDTEKARRFARIAIRVSTLSFILGILFELLFQKYGKVLLSLMN